MSPYLGQYNLIMASPIFIISFGLDSTLISILRGGGGGGGGGGFRPLILETLISRYKLKGKARTRPDFF